MKYNFTFLLLLISLVTNCQYNYGIVKFYAYSSVQQQGNIPVDANGNPVYLHTDTLYKVYVEAKRSKDTMHWKTAWLNGRVYGVVTEPDERKVLEIGSSTTNNEKLIICIPEKNMIWLLRLVPAKIKSNPPQKIQKGELLLSAIYKKKIVSLKINKITPLQLPPVQ